MAIDQGSQNLLPPELLEAIASGENLGSVLGMIQEELSQRPLSEGLSAEQVEALAQSYLDALLQAMSNGISMEQAFAVAEQALTSPPAFQGAPEFGLLDALSSGNVDGPLPSQSVNPVFGPGSGGDVVGAETPGAPQFGPAADPAEAMDALLVALATGQELTPEQQALAQASGFGGEGGAASGNQPPLSPQAQLLASLATGTGVPGAMHGISPGAGSGAEDSAAFQQALGQGLAQGESPAQAAGNAGASQQAFVTFSGSSSTTLSPSQGSGFLQALASGENLGELGGAVPGGDVPAGTGEAAYTQALLGGLADGSGLNDALGLARQAAASQQRFGTEGNSPLSPEEQMLTGLATGSEVSSQGPFGPSGGQDGGIFQDALGQSLASGNGLGTALGDARTAALFGQEGPSGQTGGAGGTGPFGPGDGGPDPLLVALATGTVTDTGSEAFGGLPGLEPGGGGLWTGAFGGSTGGDAGTGDSDLPGSDPFTGMGDIDPFGETPITSPVQPGTETGAVSYTEPTDPLPDIGAGTGSLSGSFTLTPSLPGLVPDGSGFDDGGLGGTGTDTGTSYPFLGMSTGGGYVTDPGGGDGTGYIAPLGPESGPDPEPGGDDIPPDVLEGPAPTPLPPNSIPGASAFSAVTFDGATDASWDTIGTNVKPSGSFTVELNVKPIQNLAPQPGADGAVALFEKQIGNGQYGEDFSLTLDTADDTTAASLRFFMTNSTQTGYALDMTGATLLNFDQWYHVAVTHDGTTGNTTVYLDGLVEVSGKSAGAKLDQANAALTMGIGYDDAGNHHLFKGEMDDIRVWSDVRTQGEINNSLNRELTGDEAELTAYWTFGNVAAGTVSDSSPNGNDAALGGDAAVDNVHTVTNLGVYQGLIFGTDADRSDILSYTIKTFPTYGNVILADNIFDYTNTDAGLNDDSFVVTIDDGIDTFDHTVNLDIV